MRKLERLNAPSSQPAAPVAAQYCATFLKPEMLHIYRQITSLRAYTPLVLTQKRENAAVFPFSPVINFRRPWTRPLRRFWQRTLLRGPLLISSGEARAIRSALHERNAALLHVYFGHIGVHLLPFLRTARLPIIVSFHGADAAIDLARPGRNRPLIELFSRATLILCRSRAIAAALAAYGCPEHKIRIHRTGIPLDRFPFTQRNPPPDGQWRLIQACRLIPKKGIETTLRAFSAFHQLHPAARLTVAGEGPLRASLSQLAASLGLRPPAVEFPGFIPETALLDLLYASHFFLHPSVTTPNGDREGVPNSMLEAMATGLPALATLHGGIPEAVSHGATGILVPEHDHPALAAALLDLASQPARFQAMSAAAGASIAAEWEIQSQTRRLEALYDEAIALSRA